jgi:hypothetical protein
MVRKKSIWILFGMLIITAWILDSAIPAGAETMKCRSAGIMVKREFMPVPDIEGYALAMGLRDGLAFFDDGEVVPFKAYSTSQVMGAQSVSQGYISFSFVDGSTIITSFSQINQPDPAGKFGALVKFTGEILKGSGRFEGIKGTMSGEGKLFKPGKGELSGRSTNDWTITYTLPTK